MRIEELRLIACGPFTGTTLDFSEGEFGLHLVYGPNEAGKSSTLRALRYLLFGFPTQMKEDRFLHDYSKLRLAATLRREDGERLDFIRKKANKNPLLLADEKTPLSEEQLAAWRNHVDEAAFRLRFGLDHADLVQGGKAIVEGQGEVGAILFAAGSGIPQMQRVQGELAEEAGKLFSPRGRNPRINETLSQLQAAKVEMRAAQHSATDGEAKERQLTEARLRRAEVERELSAADRELKRLERIMQGVPLVAARRRLLADKLRLADAPLLPAQRAAERVALETRLEGLAKATAEAEALLARTEAEATAPVAPALLAAASTIDDLHQRLGSHRKALEDRKRLAAELKQLESDSSAMLRDLGYPPALSDAESLRLTKPARVRIQNLAASRDSTLKRVEQAAAQRAALAQEHAGLAAALAALPAIVDETELAVVAARVAPAASTVAAWQDLEQKIAVAARQAEVDLKKLPLWTGTLEALETLAIPTDATLQRLAQEWHASHETLRREQAVLHKLAQDREQLEAEYEAERRSGETPTEDDLTSARALRDRGWQLVAAACRGQTVDADARRAFLTELAASTAARSSTLEAPPADLPAAFAVAMKHVDEISDRLRREADRVARLANLHLRISEACDEHARQQRLVEVASTAVANQTAAWQALWQPLGIVPLAPVEMQAWLYKQAALVKQSQSLREERLRAAELRGRIEAATAEMARALAACDRSAAAGASEGSHEQASLVHLVEQAREVIESARQERQSRSERQARFAALAPAIEHANKQHAEAEAALAGWQADWSAAVAPLRRDGATSPAEAQAVLEGLTEFFAKLDAASSLKVRIAGIDADRDRFAAEVERVALEIAADLAEKPFDQIVDQMYERLKEARLQHDRLQRLGAEREAAQQKQASAAAERTSIHEKLARFCREARCKDIADLPRAEERSQERQKCESDLAQCEAELARIAQLPDLSLFVSAVESEAAATLQTRRDESQKRVAAKTQELRLLEQTIGGLQAQLDQLDGRSVAAEAAAKVEDLLAQLRGDAEEYLRLKLAAELLERAIERHREKSQGPVIRRAGELFARLTLGSFETLRVDADEDGKLVLFGLRSGGERVPVQGMSEGTADQLYLALRIASLEHYLDEHPPLPFILDDILINFDDARAIAALDVLAELSRRTQVIFFTHHEHLLALAEQQLTPGLAFAQRLSTREPAAIPKPLGSWTPDRQPRPAASLFGEP